MDFLYTIVQLPFKTLLSCVLFIDLCSDFLKWLDYTSTYWKAHSKNLLKGWNRVKITEFNKSSGAYNFKLPPPYPAPDSNPHRLTNSSGRLMSSIASNRRNTRLLDQQRQIWGPGPGNTDLASPWSSQNAVNPKLDQNKSIRAPALRRPRPVSKAALDHAAVQHRCSVYVKHTTYVCRVIGRSCTSALQLGIQV